tara:strand:- start:7494 stop:8039 length:546 start_codon:yes stop_codon:yes gene_type:complete
VDSENPYTMDEEQFEFFTEAVETALEFVDIPEGAIDGESIASGSITPDKCNLETSWEFTGDVSSPSIRSPTAGVDRKVQEAIKKQTLRITKVSRHHKLSDESVVLVNAHKKAVSIALPPASDNENRVYHVKRVDDNTQSSCVLVPARGDKIDLVASISIPERGCITCISSGDGWHVLSNYS